MKLEKKGRVKRTNRGKELAFIVVFTLILAIFVYAGSHPIYNLIDSFNRGDNANVGVADSGSTWEDGGGCAISSNALYCSARAEDGNTTLTGLGQSNIINITIDVKLTTTVRDGVINFYDNGDQLITALIFYHSPTLANLSYGHWNKTQSMPIGTYWGNYNDNTYQNITINFNSTSNEVRFFDAQNDTGWVPALQSFNDVVKIGVQDTHVGGNNNEMYINQIVSYAYQPDNFSITLKDSWNNNTLNVFNLTINGTQYNITGGSVTTNIDGNATTLLDITINAPNFLEKTYNSYDIDGNFGILNANATFGTSRHNITAFLWPQNTSAVNNFTLNLTDGQNFNISSGSKLVNTSWNTSVGITINTNNYADQTYTTNGTKNENHQFNLRTEDTFYLSFYDDITGQLLLDDISIELINDVSGGNYSTENGSIAISLLTPSDYVIRFSTDWSFEREHHITLTDDTYEQIDLYALNKTYDNLVSATGVTLSVITNLNDDLEDATIIASKYFVNESDYNVVERLKTNFEGEVKGYFTNDEFYKFFIYYGGELVLTTTATKITDSTLTFVVDISEDPTGDYFTTENIDYTLTYNNNTEQFVYVYSDGSSSSSYNCLYIYRKSITEETAINSSCSSASSGTLSVTINPINGTTYLAKTTALIDGETYLIDAIIYEHGLGKELGLVGAIIILFITIAFLFVGRWNPTIMIMFLPLPTLFGAIIGLVAIPVAVMVSITLGCWIIAGVLSRNS